MHTPIATSARRPRHIFRASVLILALFAAACSDDTTSSEPEDAATEEAGTTTTTESSATTTTTTEPPAPALFDARGPYDVGVVTIDLGDRFTEVYYPAEPDPGAETEVFDTLAVFPENLQEFIPEELSGLTETTAYRDAPPLAEVPTGGFPIAVYSHGFGGFRQVATFHTSHLASWGHVVISTDHLERGIAAQASGTLGGGAENQDVLDVINSIEAVTADERFATMADPERVVITGHSAGAGTSARAAAEDIIDGYISISGGAPEMVTQKPAMVIIGELDAVVPAERSYDLYEQLDTAVLVNIADGGHNSFTDSCRGIRDLGGLGALSALIGEEQVGRAEDGCVEPFVEPEVPKTVLNHYTVRFLFDLFGDEPLEDPVADVSALLVVEDLDEGETGTVPVEFADFQPE